MTRRTPIVLVAIAVFIVIVSVSNHLHASSKPGAVTTISSEPRTTTPSTTLGPTTTTSLHSTTSSTLGTSSGRDPGLPNPSRTPGATYSLVTQSTIGSTICVSGFTRTIRPSSSYTTDLKIAQLDSGYNYHGDLATSNYEEDHLIPLEVGGSPTSVNNLWPEPRHVNWNASEKDQLENRLHELVCSNEMSLASAQHIFTSNWITGFKQYVGSLN